MREVGFMQGRLVNQIGAKIQAFPWEEWQIEFPRARDLGLTLIEWTLDDDRMSENPFITIDGQDEIRRLSKEAGIRVQSLTGDCFMQAPFWKVAGEERAARLIRLDQILTAARNLGVRFVVVPLVDAGRLEDDQQEDILVTELLKRREFLVRSTLQIIFETDLAPLKYFDFISNLPADAFNINYDMGNSASLGFDPDEEFSAYGERIVNVHVKDRLFGGTTVPLGSGCADFSSIFHGLAELNYSGDFILQTARASTNYHADVLMKYLRMTQAWIAESYGS